MTIIYIISDRAINSLLLCIITFVDSNLPGQTLPTLVNGLNRFQAAPLINY